VAREDHARGTSSRDGREAASGQAEELQEGSGTGAVASSFRTPLYTAQHSERYARQEIIRRYEKITGSSLIVVIDQIFAENMTYLEELLFDCAADKPLHVLLASPGGDGETAVRIVRSMQARCSGLTVLVPDMAKSAATLLCLGADRILMGPGGDLGPVDPQLAIGGRSLVSAKEIVEAVAEAERRIKASPETFPLFANLLADVNMLMVEQARSALARSGALVSEALESSGIRTPEQVQELTQLLQAPLIADPHSHSAVISADAAHGFGLPVEKTDPSSDEWALVWSLWTRYFTIGCFPAGMTAVYEGRRASHIFGPA